MGAGDESAAAGGDRARQPLLPAGTCGSSDPTTPRAASSSAGAGRGGGARGPKAPVPSRPPGSEPRPAPPRRPDGGSQGDPEPGTEAAASLLASSFPTRREKREAQRPCSSGGGLRVRGDTGFPQLFVCLFSTDMEGGHLQCPALKFPEDYLEEAAAP